MAKRSRKCVDLLQFYKYSIMTKKAFLLIVCAWISSIAWSSERIEVNGVYYLFHGDSATVTYTGVEKLGPYTFPVSDYSGTVIVPDSVQYEGNWYHVTEVGNNAFQQSYVRSVTLPESVTKIGTDAFRSATDLQSINIPSGVTYIEDKTFAGCNSLPVINGIRYADTYLLATTDKTQSNYTISEGTKWIAEEAFKDCSAATSITLPSSILSIGTSVFRGCTSLTSVTIENNPRYTSVDGILYTAALDTILCYPSGREEEDIVIPDHVTVVAAGAYVDNTHIKSLQVPENVTKIVSTAFTGCDSLTKLTIASPSIVETNYDRYIGNGFFSIFGSQVCGTTLAECIIESPVSAIGKACFEYCGNLRKVTLPEGLKRIEEDAFLYCSKLREINLPESMKSIGTEAFMGCSELSNIHLSDSLTSLGTYAFYGCSSLTNVHIPSSLTTLSNSVFRGAGLRYIHIPSNITTIEPGAFMACKQLQGVRLSEGLQSMAYGTFYACTDLKYIICEAQTPPSCNSECFKDVNYAIPLYVPADSISAYQAAETWSNFTNIQGIAYADMVETSEELAVDTNGFTITFTWTLADSAVLYSLEITTADSTICRQLFTQDAILMDSTVHVTEQPSTTAQAPMTFPARMNKANESESFGILYSVSNLQPNIQYHYQLTALNDAFEVVKLYNGTFTTNGDERGLDEIRNDSKEGKRSNSVKKVVRNNKVYIIHGQDIFDLSGSKATTYH